MGLAICTVFESKIRLSLARITTELMRRGAPYSVELNCIASARIRTLLSSLEINNAFSKIYSAMTSSKIKSISSFFDLEYASYIQATKLAKEHGLSEKAQRLTLLSIIRNRIVLCGISIYKDSMMDFIKQLQTHIGEV